MKGGSCQGGAFRWAIAPALLIPGPANSVELQETLVLGGFTRNRGIGSGPVAKGQGHH